MAFCDWLLRLSIMFSRFIHIITKVRISFLFMPAWYSMVRIYHISSIHSSIDGHLGCFHFLIIMNNATLNFRVQVFAWTYVFISLGICLGGEFLGHVGSPYVAF